MMHHGNTTSPSSPDEEAIQKTSKLSQSVLIAFGCCYGVLVALSLVTMTVGYTAFIKLFITPLSLFINNINALLDPVLYCLRMESVKDEVYPGFKISLRERKCSKDFRQDLMNVMEGVINNNEFLII